MAAVSARGVQAPGRSQIEHWDTSHLERAARDWVQVAEGWEDNFSTAQRGAMAPGGTDWDGQAAEAAQQRALSDLFKVRGLADTLHAAGTLARSGASDIDLAKQQAIDSIRRAEEAGFEVHDDLSLSSREKFAPGPQAAAKLAQGQAFAAEISTRALQLAAVDAEVAAKITTAVTPLGEVSFPEVPMPLPTPQHGTVQAVDFKQGPNMSPTPEPGGSGGGGEPKDPWAPHPDYSNRTNNGKYGQGNSADGEAAAEAALEKREEDSGIPIIRDQVRATHPDVIDPKTGKPQQRYYDGLEPTGNPDEYIGVEAKTNPGALRSDQQRFDAAVSPERPATATLNGRPIRIVGAEVEYPPDGWVPPSAGTQPGAGTTASTEPGRPVAGPATAPPPAPTTAGGGGGGGSWGDELEKGSAFPNWGTQLTPQQMIDSDDPALRVAGQEIRRRMAEKGLIDPSGTA